MIIGHETIRHYFENAALNGILHHAYCFVGDASVGKRTVAYSIAAHLLKVPENKLTTHPDFCYVERSVDEKTGKLHKEISVSEARTLRERLQSRSWLGGYRVVIIDEAELLNLEASNALLKTLEEPAEKSIIFLLTENEEILLPTIRSRVQLFHFSLVPDVLMERFLVSLCAPAERAAELTVVAAGRPGQAKNLVTDDRAYTSWKEEAQRWGELLNQPFYKKLAVIENLFGDKGDGVRGRERLLVAIEIWIMLWREALLFKIMGSSGTLVSFVPRLSQPTNHSAEGIVFLIDRLNQAKFLLARNVQPRLVLEQAILDF